MAMAKKLSDAELEIMLVVWHSKQPVTSTFILENLKEKRNWVLSTLMSVLTRLSQKGYLSCDRTTRTNLYSSIITENEYKAVESKNLLERLYGNSLRNLVTSLYDERSIDEKDLSELRSFLNGLEGRNNAD